METKTKTERRQNCNYQEGTCDNYTYQENNCSSFEAFKLLFIAGASRLM